MKWMAGAWACWLWATISICPAEAGVQLARVDLRGPASDFPLPVLAQLQDASGRDYLLVKAEAGQLESSGWSFRILDDNAESADYILAYEFRPGARAAARKRFDVVHDDGRRLLVRAVSGDELEELAHLGFQCRRPAPVPPDLVPSRARDLSGVSRMATFASNAMVAAMMAQVRPTNLYLAFADLTGERPVMADGIFTNIYTRHQNSGVPLRRATALARVRFEEQGWQAGWHGWTNGGRSNRNVVAVRPGAGAAAAEIVVVCAHIDDMPAAGKAPGADDNASGVVAALAVAEILGGYSFERTIRIVLFTGEEQGMLGSEVYARAARAAGDDIVAVLNLDMIGWDGDNDGVLHLYVRPVSSPGHAADRRIAAAFTNVVHTYGLRPSLAPRIIAEMSDWSDHYSFLAAGYPAVCAIQDDVSDFNPHYHTANDTLARINLAYHANFVKAVVGTAAHLAGSKAPAWDAGHASIGGGWRRLAWFGDYIPMGSAGWIWHNKHRFFYVPASATPQHIWLYAQDMGWLYTRSTQYPFLYRANDRAWLWYNGATHPRWFRNMAAGRWERRP